MHKLGRMKVIIVSPEKTLFNGDAQGVVVPGEGGAFEILKGHAPIISTLSAGNIKVITEEVLQISISGGFVEVANDEVSICVEI